MAAVSATTRACWPVLVAWSRQASRLARRPVPRPAPAPVGQVGDSGRTAPAGGPGRGGPAGDAGLGAGGGVLVVVQQPGDGTVAVVGRVGGGQVPGVARGSGRACRTGRGRLGQQVLIVQGVQAAAGVRQSVPARAAAA